MKKKDKKKLKFDLQVMFWVTSIIFILVCIFWYGGRFAYLYLENREKLIKNDMIFAEKLKNVNYENSNFKKRKKTYYFTGKSDNNYVIYSNFLWRIVKVNEDNSILLVSEDVIGSLAYGDNNSDYNSSNLISWLNNEENGKFIKILNTKEKYLINNSICTDIISDVKNITCNNVNSNNYLDLISLEDYLNTGGINGFINNNKYTYFSNKNENNEIWYVDNTGKLDTTLGDDIIGFKTTITLSATLKLSSGNGTINNPYKFESDSSTIGSYVKLANDMWRIYEEKDGVIKLVLQDFIKNGSNNLEYNYSNKDYIYNGTIKNSLANYLNNTYYNSLSYKSLIIENNYSNGLYGNGNKFDYKNISTKTIKTKVAVPSIDDIILNDKLTNYFTSTGKLENNEAIYVFKNNGFTTSRIITSTEGYVVPCISVKKENLKVGSGSIADPYRTE